jgi:hypothetical protein
MARSYTVTAETGQHTKTRLIVHRWYVDGTSVTNLDMMLSFKQTSDTSKRPFTIDERKQCPICLLDVADLPSRTILTKHLASHLERFSLDCLPLDTSSWGDQNIHDSGSESSDPDQDLYPEPHKQTFSDEQEVGGVSSEDETTGDSRVEETQWPDGYVRGRGDQFPDLPGEHLRMSKWTAEGEELRTSELTDAATEEYDLLHLERIRSQKKQVEEKLKHWRELPSAEWNSESYNSGSGAICATTSMRKESGSSQTTSAESRSPRSKKVARRPNS